MLGNWFIDIDDIVCVLQMQWKLDKLSLYALEILEELKKIPS